MSEGHVVTILGCGFMGTALLTGLLASASTSTSTEQQAKDNRRVKRFYACVRTEESADRLKRLFASHNEVEVIKDDNHRAVISADCVILGFQPADLGKILSGTDVLAQALARALAEKLVISMIAGVSSYTLTRMIHARHNPIPRVIRVMPSIGAQFNQSCSLIGENQEQTSSDMDMVSWMFSQVGSITHVPENLLDTAVAISATTHALTTTVVDAITTGSVSRGMPRKEAQKIAAACLQSASSMLVDKMTLEELKDAMSVPQGITTEAWIHLDAGNIRSATAQTVRHAVDYAQSMNENKPETS